MCDESLLRHFGRTNLLSRRHFGALSAAGGASLLLPRAADALEVTAATVEVPTADGIADCHFCIPPRAAIPVSSCFRMRAACAWSTA